MKPRLFHLAWVLVLTLGLSACAGLDALNFSGPQGPTPVPIASPTPSLSAESLFVVLPPDGTPQDAQISLVVLDPVAGYPYNQVEHPMEQLDDGRWQVRLTPAVGSILHYRYVRNQPTRVDEASAFSSPIESRIAAINAPSQIEDIIPAWADVSYTGSTGRIVGSVLQSDTDEPLSEILVSAAGVSTFTDGEGGFRLDGLPLGLHQLTAISLDGAHKAVQQGAVVAAESTTPAELRLRPANKVLLTFELTVPEDTIPGTPVRMVGNLTQLGNRFAELPGGVRVSPSAAPTLTFVDETHYIMFLEAYEGSDVRYAYSLGDGLWNTERTATGALNTRQIIVPGEDTTIVDTVSTWRSGNRGSIRFHVTVPAETPSEDVISIQFNPFTWFEPLPMWRLSDTEWYFVLHSPLDFSGSLGYRFCRNLQCGGADDVDTAGEDAIGRQITPGAVSQDQRDFVTAWRWLEPPSTTTSIVAPEIEARTNFEVGVEYLPRYGPPWTSFEALTFQELESIGATNLTLTPTWTMGSRAGLPLLEFNPGYAPYATDLKRTADLANESGLDVILRPTLIVPQGSLHAWWLASERDLSWWTTWFDEYRSFVLTYAALADEIDAKRLVIGGPEAGPALPGATLFDGTESGVPQDSEARWRTLIDEARELYDGDIALELEVSSEGINAPTFLDAFEAIHLYWHAPIAESPDAPISDMQSAAHQIILDQILSNRLFDDKRLILSVEYPSVVGGAGACPNPGENICGPVSDFDQGASPNESAAVDLDHQAEAINAMILEAYQTTQIEGYYVRRFNPSLGLQDKSASVRGKPARDVLWFWYPRLTDTMAE